MTVKKSLFIGELSRQVGIPTGTIRYYERLGLLNPPLRTRSRYRVYSPEDSERLRFIRKAKGFGLSLDEIKKLIDISAEGVAPCASLKAMVKQHIDQLDHHIQEMMAWRQVLAGKYEQIEALLPDSTAIPNHGLFNDEVCGLIERSNGDELS